MRVAARSRPGRWGERAEGVLSPYFAFARNTWRPGWFVRCSTPCEDSMKHLSQQTADAITTLQHCHAICASMAMTHCLEMGGEHPRPQHLRLMLDCAAFCAFTADALGRK